MISAWSLSGPKSVDLLDTQPDATAAQPEPAQDDASLAERQELLGESGDPPRNRTGLQLQSSEQFVLERPVDCWTAGVERPRHGALLHDELCSPTD
jgi:hypothetical protein